jgi:hypothetical protein
MELNKSQKLIWDRVCEDLDQEPVASPDHVERMTTWCQKLGSAQGADLETLVAGALVHDIGVPADRKNHFINGAIFNPYGKRTETRGITWMTKKRLQEFAVPFSFPATDPTGWIKL